MRPSQLHWGRWPPVGRRELGRLFQDSGAWGSGRAAGEVRCSTRQDQQGGLPRGGGGLAGPYRRPLRLIFGLTFRK